jgi:CDP-paratose 2-epimerase
MTCLVTGGCGFVGCNIAARLLEMGRHVVVCDNLSRKGSAANLAWLRSLGPVDFQRADVRIPAEITAVVSSSQPAAVFHLAGQVAMTTSVANPRLDFETNAVGTFNLLEAVRNCAPRCPVIYASTNKVYGELRGIRLVEERLRYATPDHRFGIDEETPLDFQTPYGCSKGAADQYVLDFARVYGLETVVFRHSTIYGGRQFASFDQGWVGWFCRQALVQLKRPGAPPFSIAGDGKQVRDLLFVDDAVDAYLAAVENICAARGHVFNLGGGMANSSSLLEFFEQLEGLTGVRLRFERTAWRHSDQRFFVADIRKAERVLGWRPRVGKTQGVARMLRWIATLEEESSG